MDDSTPVSTARIGLRDCSGITNLSRILPHINPWIPCTHPCSAAEYMHRYRNPLDPKVYPRESTGEWINPSEHFMFSVAHDELADRSRPSANFHAGFFRVGPYWPWMLMGDTRLPGYLTARCHSYKLKPGLGNIPPAVLRWTETNRPEFLAPPEEGPDTQPRDTWMGYRLERPPVPPLRPS